MPAGFSHRGGRILEFPAVILLFFVGKVFMKKTMEDGYPSTAIWWIRRDLRLGNNLALQTALESAREVIPVFILDPTLTGAERTARSRLSFLWEGLKILRGSLREKGADLVVRRGNPREELTALVNQTGARVVHAEEDFSPYARKRDGQIQKEISLRLHPGLMIAHPESIEKNSGGPYQVYSYYMRKWKEQLPGLPGKIWLPPERIPFPSGIPAGEIPDGSQILSSFPFPPGESEARNRLQAFVEGDPPPIYRYDQDRDRPDLEGTSTLSPYLHLGMLSIREAVRAAMLAIQDAPDSSGRESAGVWLKELIWREFYLSILYHFPHVLDNNFQPDYDHIPWRNDPREFTAWKNGRTGYPFVDAAMRQLLERQWMHNRSRMIVASFLVKDLLIDWRWGEEWFMKNLMDGDLAANNGGWQWAAGTGTDAAPYFRIFNPISQGKKFDPRGTYIRTYLPECSAVPDRYIHTPWEMPEDLQRERGFVLGEQYPYPIVDHKMARERTLAAYRSSRAKSS